MRKMNVKTKWACTLVIASIVAACGGGGGSPALPPLVATTTTTTTTTPTAVVPVAADLIVSLDKAALNNSGSDQATLTVVAVDGSRNVVASVPVAVAVDSNAVYTPASGTTTGTDGTYGGKITIGADKSNRLIRYTVTSGTLTKTGAISVSGISITATTVPAKPQPGASVTLTVTVKDSAAKGVAGAAVTASGIPGATFASTQTDGSGVAAYTFTAPSADGFYTIAAQSAGATGSYSLQVQSSGSSAVPGAVGSVSGASAIANPVVVAANIAGSTSSQSEIRALFYAANNVPIPNMRVRFSVVSTALPGEALSTGSNLVYSDNGGAAITSYIAATSSSPTNGVVVRACYDVADFPASSCPNFVQTTLTVTSSPVSLTVGSDNVIGKSPSGISYIKQFEIQAVDSAGNAKSDVQLSAVVDIDGYWKGPPTPNPATLLTTDIPTSGPTMTHKWCINEDLNRNGVLDAGEDTNTDGFLTPRKSDVAIAFVGGVSKTNATGLATLQLTYPQNLASWLRVRITVTAGVSGSEGSATYVYILKFAETDAANGSFLTPPYGRNLTCTNAQ